MRCSGSAIRAEVGTHIIQMTKHVVEEGVADVFVLTNKKSFEHYATVNSDALIDLDELCCNLVREYFAPTMPIHITVNSSFLMSKPAQAIRFAKVITVVKVE